MPRGPRGEKRPADVIGNGVKVMRIATSEETEALPIYVMPAIMLCLPNGRFVRSPLVSKIDARRNGGAIAAPWLTVQRASARPRCGG
jgi:hypothetical protein